MPGRERWDGSLSVMGLAILLALAVAPLSGCSAGTGLPRGRASAADPGLERGFKRPAPKGPIVPFTFAVIGDYGSGDHNEAAVAALVATWDPAFVITTGDDYYAAAGGIGTARYDASTGRFYCRWLTDVSTTGSSCRIGRSSVNAFFPAIGNHDYRDAVPGPGTYLQYFNLPGKGFRNTSGNERYYDFVQGSVHFFVLNSCRQEPDGTSSTSKQALWLRRGLAASTSHWNVVYGHHPPYSSDRRGTETPRMRWPFDEWGADAVLSGHSHDYERIERDNILYFVNGLGGSRLHGFGPPVAGTRKRFNADWGAQKVTVSPSGMTFTFYDITGRAVDSATLPAR